MLLAGPMRALARTADLADGRTRETVIGREKAEAPEGKDVYRTTAFDLSKRTTGLQMCFGSLRIRIILIYNFVPSCSQV